MRALAARAYFVLCLASGWLLRCARYSSTQIVHQNGDPSTRREPRRRPEQGAGATSSGSSRARSGDEREVRKHRRFYAPLLVWMGGALLRMLDTGVRVLPQRDWVKRERLIYRSLRGASIRVDGNGVLVLPVLGGHTLATLLEDPELVESARMRAIERAVVALAEFHRLGFTHGDAMAENVLVDLGAGAAHWFDFETLHDSNRSIVWRRADDVRALLVTCLIRTVPEQRAATLEFMLDVYADEEVTSALATTFTSVWRRSLAFHLAQAGLSFECFCEIGRLLRQRSGGCRHRV